jgi:hypothetical protein
MNPTTATWRSGMPILAAALAVLLTLLSGPAAAVNENAGTTGYGFLKVGVGARPAALGGAFTAVAGDLEGATWNPAGLTGIGQRAAALSLTSYLVDTEAGFAGIAVPRGQRTWAASATYFSYGQMRRTDETGQDLGSFGASDLAAAVTVAQPLWNGRLSVGASLKAVYSSIDSYSSDAYMTDLGLLLQGPISGMTLGASLSNLGFVRQGYAGGYKDSLPVNLRLGVAHRPAHLPLPLLLVADVNLPNDGDPFVAVGAEVRVAGGFYLRPGYSTQQTGAAGEDPLGLTAGVGLVIQRYRLDYAFASYPDLGDVHRVSLSGGF